MGLIDFYVEEDSDQRSEWVVAVLDKNCLQIRFRHFSVLQEAEDFAFETTKNLYRLHNDNDLDFLFISIVTGKPNLETILV